MRLVVRLGSWSVEVWALGLEEATLRGEGGGAWFGMAMI